LGTCDNAFSLIDGSKDRADHSTWKSRGEFCAVLEPRDVSVSADSLFIDRVEELVGRGAGRVID
jgi:hypothetical protein